MEVGTPPAPPAPSDTSGVVGAGLVPAVLALADAISQERLRAGRDLFGVGVTELAALEWLAASERTPTQLADHLHLTTASVTGLVDRLAADGLVDRRPHPSDRRKVLVALTPGTAERMAEWTARVGATARRATSHLTVEEQARLVQDVSRLAEAFGGPHTRPRRPKAAPPDRTALSETLERITSATDAFTRPARRP